MFVRINVMKVKGKLPFKHFTVVRLYGHEGSIKFSKTTAISVHVAYMHID